MNNVIPLKRSEHCLPDHERRELVNALTEIARQYHDFGCLREKISKCVNDALKRDKPKTFADEIHERSMASWRADLKKESEDGESNVPA